MSASSGYGSGGSGPVGPAILTLEGNVGGPVGPTAGGNLFVPGVGPVVTTGNPGTNTISISLDGTVATQYTEDVGVAVPAAGNLNIIGGASTAGINMNTFGSGSTVEVILNDSLFFPQTNSSGTEGVLYWAGSRFLHNYGVNVFLGLGAGNFTLNSGVASSNVGVGYSALTALVGSAVNLGTANTAIGNGSLLGVTDGSFNCAVGSAGLLLTTGVGNVFIGHNCAPFLVNGNTNVLIGGDDNFSGASTGSQYLSNESSNILLQHPGVTGDQNVMRLGDDGSGDAEINSTYMAGVYNRSYGSPSGVVQIDSNFKVGSSAGTDGQLLIGDTGGSPVWANLTSTGGTVVITNAAGAINLEATGTGAGASSFPVDIDGPATEAGGVLNILGGPGTISGVTNIHTQAVALSNTVHVVLNDSVYFPNTNTAGTGGVLYWNSVPTVQFYGSGNTFVGKAAGNLTLTTGSAIDNTALGESCLPALTTSPENTFIGSNAGTLLSSGSGLNTAAGFSVLDNLVSGSNNIALGVLAGTNYTSNESNNIVIGSFGTAADANTIRIGRTQTAAYMEGIYGASIGTTNAPVFIDNTGKLGTLEGGFPLDGSSFSAVVGPANDTFASIALGPHYMGVGEIMNIRYNNFGSAFDPGDGVGTPATFTAPIDGFYNFNTIYVINSDGGSTSNPIIVVNDVIFYSTLKSSVVGELNINIELTAGDVVKFGVQLTSKNINVTFLEFVGGIGSEILPFVCYASGQLLRSA